MRAARCRRPATPAPATPGGRGSTGAICPDWSSRSPPYELVGGAPGIVTAGAVDGWYATLARPAYAPPNWVFAPVWALLFATMGVAAYLVHRAGTGSARRRALGLFAGQFALNVAWTLAFFGAESLGGGLVVIVALWIAIAGTILAFWRIRGVAGALLVPSLAWVTFAALLNYGFWALN